MSKEELLPIIRDLSAAYIENFGIDRLIANMQFLHDQKLVWLWFNSHKDPAGIKLSIEIDNENDIPSLQEILNFQLPENYKRPNNKYYAVILSSKSCLIEIELSDCTNGKYMYNLDQLKDGYDFVKK